MRFILTLVFLSLLQTIGIAQKKNTIRVGAKHFNEGYILSEIIALILEDGGFVVDRKFNLGGTAVSFEALLNNAIDIYPEYTGTIASEILKQDQEMTLEEISVKLNAYNLKISDPFGFNNTYALLVDSALSQKYAIRNISDLEKYPDLRLGLSYEFMKRRDGWENLAQFYKLTQKPTALEHGLAYQAILEHKIDVTDAYSTDGEIVRYNLVLLNDDRNFFPEYHAVSFYKHTLPAEAITLLSRLTSSISEEEMQRMNGLALYKGLNHRDIALQFLIEKGLIQERDRTIPTDTNAILEKTWVHVKLTLLALLAAMFLAIPLGVLIYNRPYISKGVLYVAGVLQTIPSIALLALMVPLFGIGMIPALIALFLYALLPILRNTVVGLATVDPMLKKVATAIGLGYWDRLRLVEFPLALPMVLTGIRTAAVINVGTATLAAFIGAGGLGEFIVTGLALNNVSLILKGAIPAAFLAIITELVFEIIEWLSLSRHLRQKIY